MEIFENLGNVIENIETCCLVPDWEVIRTFSQPMSWCFRCVYRIIHMSIDQPTFVFVLCLTYVGDCNVLDKSLKNKIGEKSNTQIVGHVDDIVISGRS